MEVPFPQKHMYRNAYNIYLSIRKKEEGREGRMEGEREERKMGKRKGDHLKLFEKTLGNQTKQLLKNQQ